MISSETINFVVPVPTTPHPQLVVGPTAGGAGPGSPSLPALGRAVRLLLPRPARSRPAQGRGKEPRHQSLPMRFLSLPGRWFVPHLNSEVPSTLPETQFSLRQKPLVRANAALGEDEVAGREQVPWTDLGRESEVGGAPAVPVSKGPLVVPLK